MRVKPQETALMVYLKGSHDVYHGKILELRDAVQGWLEYIPQSFPHYTRHTIKHSDEIVLQLSKLLFRDDDPSKPVIRLSAVETYILVASAYLHDVGMVVSDSEKVEILKSSAWKKWTEENGGGHKRWVQIKEFRAAQKPAEETVRNFLADVQTRFLIADFIRRQHHKRGARVITMHQHALGRFAFDDPILMRTVANICVAHGLTQHELEDNELYPARCDVQGEKVNVRFLAILLRIGDLLDMSSDRACPLLLNAASPLPSESLAHWTKYQRIIHRLTAPDKIELKAECHTQEEHRFLQDWCQWLVNEVREAAVIMSRVARHSDWVPPTVSLDGPSPTIIIRPTQDANYIPSRWTFEMDQDAVLKRLMKDIYSDPMAFVLELIQNALDATRCQMYLDLEKDRLELPEYPTQVEEDRRSHYPVKVKLGTAEILNELSGETETRQVLTVEDCGIGMDKEIITRYFLQVGRSYYQTDEFRRSFPFQPSSQFGIGFLSVFAVSDHVIVDTCKPTSRRADDPIRLILRGPRNYLLTERGSRQSCGTRIEVMLREPIEEGELTKMVKNRCKRVEFPILVDELGDKKTIVSERSEQFTYEIPDLTEKGAKFILRAFPINQKGIEGELYIFFRKNSEGESWDKWEWANITYPEIHPGAFSPPHPPRQLICRNGIQSLHILEFGLGYFRIDVRCNVPWMRALSIAKEVILSKLKEILEEHLAREPKANLRDGWLYKQNLVKEFPHYSFWYSCPETIRVWIKGKTTLLSLKEAVSLPVMTTTIDLTNSKLYLVHWYHYPHILDVKENPSFDNDYSTLTDTDIELLSLEHRRSIFVNRKPKRVRWLKSNHIAIDWKLSPREKMDSLFQFEYYEDSSSIAKLPDPHLIGFFVHETTMRDSHHILLNSNHPFVHWILKLRNLQLSREPPLKEREYTRFLELIRDCVLYYHNPDHCKKLLIFLDWLRQSRKLPSELLPPRLRIAPDMFALRPQHK